MAARSQRARAHPAQPAGACRAAQPRCGTPRNAANWGAGAGSTAGRKLRPRAAGGRGAARAGVRHALSRAPPRTRRRNRAPQGGAWAIARGGAAHSTTTSSFLRKSDNTEAFFSMTCLLYSPLGDMKSIRPLSSFNKR